MAEPRVVILGAGPAGLGAAWRLRERNQARVTVLERATVPGGNAGSFEFAGQRVDFGSHRLHPACDPGILSDLKTMLGEDLLDRPRHGRIGLRGKWIHFPLKPGDLLLRLDRGFALGAARDMVLKPFRSNGGADTFEAVLRASLGPTICDDFYFPYVRKIWGLPPEEISGIQARRRVSASSPLKLVRKVLSQVPGLKPPGAGRFYYPRRGFGQIVEAYADAATRRGAEIRYGTQVVGLTPPAGPGQPWQVATETAGTRATLEADHLWSTIPITALARLYAGELPPAVADAARAMSYRAMLLRCLALDVDRFTEFDAHYFPAANLRITRLSEPKNYAALTEPRGRTVLCAELPCSPEDPWWSMDDAELGRLVMEDLATAGVPAPVAPSAVLVRRLPQAYPTYRVGYEKPFGVLDDWAGSLPGFLSYGRQGLFAHDNTHHALRMAYAAAECLTPAGFDRSRWAGWRTLFDQHVVED